MPKEYIETAAGRAYYLKTEVENEYGRWNDSYYTGAGEYVIHEGRLHHVYKIRGLPAKFRL
jgi:hypothetical protein